VHNTSGEFEGKTTTNETQ